MNVARNNVRNRYVEEFQKKYNTASKTEGNYYILNETPEQKNARYEKEHAQTGKAADNSNKPAATPEPGKPGAVDQAKKAGDAAKKAGVTAKAGQKALPKTHAAK